MAISAKCFVVFGANEHGLPYAGRFEGNSEADAQAAATEHNYRLLAAASAAQTVAHQVPKAEKTVAGKWLLHGISAKLAADLAELGRAQARAEEESFPIEAPKPQLDLDWWRSIGMGSAVLATAPGVEGWWPCEVVGLPKKGDMLTLKWIGYQEPAFMVARNSVALLPPGGDA